MLIELNTQLRAKLSQLFTKNLLSLFSLGENLFQDSGDALDHLYLFCDRGRSSWSFGLLLALKLLFALAAAVVHQHKRSQLLRGLAFGGRLGPLAVHRLSNIYMLLRRAALNDPLLLSGRSHRRGADPFLQLKSCNAFSRFLFALKNMIFRLLLECPDRVHVLEVFNLDEVI